MMCQARVILNATATPPASLISSLIEFVSAKSRGKLAQSCVHRRFELGKGRVKDGFHDRGATMHITVPFSYRTKAIPNRGSNARDITIMEMERFEVANIKSEEAPIAVAWVDKAADKRHYTRFANGSHWLRKSDLTTIPGPLEVLMQPNPDPEAAAQAMLDLAAVFKLKSSEMRLLKEYDLSGDYVGTYHLADATAKKVRQTALLNARLKASDLMTCDDGLYVRCSEPRLRLGLIREKRSPHTLVQEVYALNSDSVEMHKSYLPIYEHRIDRLSNFKDFLQENPPSLETEVEDRIGEINIFDDRWLALNDDEQAMRSVIKDIISAFEECDPKRLSDEAISLYRSIIPDKMSGEQMEAFLRPCLGNKHPIMAATDSAANYRVLIKQALDRWELRPLDHSSTMTI
jgi:hypothetical protein